MNAPLIAADKHVELEYSLFDHVSGDQLNDEPIRVDYVHGYEQVLPALEKGLVGLAQGQDRSIVAQPAEAFGVHDVEGVFELEKEGLDGADELEVGEEFVASGPEGDVLMRVLEVRKETLLIDTNHPLAGRTVRFSVKVLSVRDATEEEIIEAQSDAEADACGCGEPHNHPDGHHDEAEPLVSLGKKPS